MLQTRKYNSREQSRWRGGSRRAGRDNCAVCRCHVYYQLLVLCQHGVPKGAGTNVMVNREGCEGRLLLLYQLKKNELVSMV